VSENCIARFVLLPCNVKGWRTRLCDFFFQLTQRSQKKKILVTFFFNFISVRALINGQKKTIKVLPEERPNKTAKNFRVSPLRRFNRNPKFFWCLVTLFCTKSHEPKRSCSSLIDKGLSQTHF
jgi:hypothetical protein